MRRCKNGAMLTTSGISLNYYDQARQLKAIRTAGDLGLANYWPLKRSSGAPTWPSKAFFVVSRLDRKPGIRVSSRIDASTATHCPATVMGAD